MNVEKSPADCRKIGKAQKFYFNVKWINPNKRKIIISNPDGFRQVFLYTEPSFEIPMRHVYSPHTHTQCTRVELR